MSPLARLLALALLAGGRETGSPPLPTLAKEPTIDGRLSDLGGALAFKLPPQAKGTSPRLAVKGAFRKDTLYLGVAVNDDHVVPADQLDLSLYFPGAGLTARGVVLRFGPEGLRPPVPELGAEPWAHALLRAATHPEPGGFTLELAVPAQALPRFPAKGPLLLTVCATYLDADDGRGAAEPSQTSSCESLDMPGGPVRVPDELRKNLRLDGLGDVEGLEPRAHGWVGFSRLHFPRWARGDAPLTPASLAELVVGAEAVDAGSAGLPLPAELVLADNRKAFGVLTGQNPYDAKGACTEGRELRLALYVIDGPAAARILEWPAANCKLGRATSLEVAVDGGLTIGYSSGSAAHFVWSGDHFERSELG